MMEVEVPIKGKEEIPVVRGIFCNLKIRHCEDEGVKKCL